MNLKNGLLNLESNTLTLLIIIPPDCFGLRFAQYVGANN